MWHGAERALYWIDVRGRMLLRRDAAGVETSWPMPATVGSIVWRQSGGLIVALATGFHAFDPANGALELLADPEPDKPANRLNDGRCDRAGRFWCGSMDAEYAESQGALIRFDPDHTCHEMDSGFTITNGMAFSPDDKALYFTDTRGDAVWRYDLDLASGTVSNRRVFIPYDTPEDSVDGATVDAEGFYWGAQVRAGRLARWDPDGKLERTVELPVGRPTMLCFGGADLDTVYVTSMSDRLSDEERTAQPLAGRVFAIHEIGVRGVPEPAFAG